ncbi:hypothetical protein [Clostridium sp. CF012]|uniref:hypothetical protein n=1 Tax=Clostridium sp. CF012 TaxID=2843319 RepID=UPI001C0DF4E3|nr:hypothetical protein [Clostridium sp. CF012]MBU3143335.1 hypothetical protein [Clostridium sp. CF012]
MKKSKKQLIQGMSFTIDMNKLNLNRRKFKSSEIGRGTGVQKIKKGKGSYTRKNVKVDDSYCGYFLFHPIQALYLIS